MPPPDPKISVFICRRGGKKQHPCYRCGRPGARLCDFPVLRGSRRGTCDVSLCDQCTTRIAGDADLCRAHARAWDDVLGRPTVGPGATEGQP